MGSANEHRLAVVVVNYRTASQTIDCARHLDRSRRPVDELVVVDNGSGDRSAPRLRTALPRATLLTHARNGGFAAGANSGIAAALEEAGARRVLLLNPDARLAPEAIDELERALDARADLGIVGPVVTSATSGLTESAGIRFCQKTGRMRLIGAGEPPSTRPSPPVLVDGVSGCAMLLGERLLERIGRPVLDERFFFGFEDLELCLRAAELGLRSACVPAARARHEASGSIGARSAARSYYAARGHLQLVRQREEHPGAPAALGRVALVAALSLAHAATQGEVPRARGLAASGRGLIDQLRGCTGPAPDL